MAVQERASLSRSLSVPLLGYARSAGRKRADRASYETMSSPASPVTARVTPSSVLKTAAVQAQEELPTKLDADACCRRSTPPSTKGSQRRPASIRTRRSGSIQLQISYSRSQDLSMVPVDEDDDVRHMSTSFPPDECPCPFASPQSASQGTPEEQRLLPSQLTQKTRRSAPPSRRTSVDTQSSSIELIAWQVATHATGETSRSDEIFRPVSVIRSVQGDSRDTPLSGTFARTMLTELACRSTPDTPLRSGIDFVADRVRPASAVAPPRSVMDFAFPLPQSTRVDWSAQRRAQSAHGRNDADNVGQWQICKVDSSPGRQSWFELDQQPAVDTKHFTDEAARWTASRCLSGPCGTARAARNQPYTPLVRPSASGLSLSTPCELAHRSLPRLPLTLPSRESPRGVALVASRSQHSPSRWRSTSCCSSSSKRPRCGAR